MAIRRVTIITVVAALLAIYAYFGIDYLRQNDAKDSLMTEVAEASQALARIPRRSKAELEERLAAATEGLSAAQGQIPTGIDSTEVVDTVLGLASDSGVLIRLLATEPWAIVQVGETEYRAIRFNLEVTGGLSQIISFVASLEDDGLPTLVLEQVKVSADEQVSRGSDASGTADLTLAVYDQPLTAD